MHADPLNVDDPEVKEDVLIIVALSNVLKIITDRYCCKINVTIHFKQQADNENSIQNAQSEI